MSEPILCGIVEFSTTIFCSPDVLGQTVDISIGGYSGTFTLPSLPDDWEKKETSPFRKPLLGPLQARTWKEGDELIDWGRPYSYPVGNAFVERALMEFSFHSDFLESVAKQVQEGFEKWLDLFEMYVFIFTTQNTDSHYTNDRPGKIELYINEVAKLRRIPGFTLLSEVQLLGENKALHLEQFREASRLSSLKIPPRLEYRLLLEAYNARRNKDYRKAIIEAANALEVCLTSRISEEFHSQGVSLIKREELLLKNRMLGGRFKLVKKLGIALPNKNYEDLINNPRNKVIHDGSFSDKKLVNQVIGEVVELLQLLSPKIHQDTPDV